eukprot:GHVS01058237.1.p1 GENE.GHVS01058237.1~~GHVS01058237.1.p1  ORF type:complete len:255 (+),score=38.04 GHVS01058237.1:876-1640(+)
MGSEAPSKKKVLVLFDLDGTLTEARKTATPDILGLLRNLRSVVSVGIVSGSDESKVRDQLGCGGGQGPVEYSDYLFLENGLVGYKDGKKIHENSLSGYLGEELVCEIVNFVLLYFSKLDLPIKRGTFIEYRTGMMNLSPIGRNCSYDERLAFNKLDQEKGIRKLFVEELVKKFDSRGLQFSIGGQISVDCFPKGWDKRYCLQFVQNEFEEIHFFGDKTYEGGNDNEIFEDSRTIGHSVTCPEDTVKKLKELFGV